MIAVLPLSTILGHDLSQALRWDFERLVPCAPDSILLNFRQVEFIDGSFFCRVLELRRELQEHSFGLTVQLSPSLAEVARVTKLDQLLELDRPLDGNMNHSKPLLIGPSPVKLLATGGLGGLGATAGVAIVFRGIFGQEWLSSTGWVICAVMACLVCCYCFLALIWRKPSIEITDQGFTAYSLFGRHDRLWSQIEGDFQNIKVGYGRGIGYRLTQKYKDSSGIKPSTLFPGSDEAISGAYGMPVRQIVAIINERKEQSVR